MLQTVQSWGLKYIPKHTERNDANCASWERQIRNPLLLASSALPVTVVKWRFIGIPYWKSSNPGGDWHPGQGDNPSYDDWLKLLWRCKRYPSHTLMYISAWTVWMPLQTHTLHHGGKLQQDCIQILWCVYIYILYKTYQNTYVQCNTYKHLISISLSLKIVVKKFGRPTQGE